MSNVMKAVVSYVMAQLSLVMDFISNFCDFLLLWTSRLNHC